VEKDLQKLQPILFPSWHAFRPDEIRLLLEASGCRVERMFAPGTLARFVEPRLLSELMKDAGAYEGYLDFERYSIPTLTC